jgi:hypothetical protein
MIATALGLVAIVVAADLSASQHRADVVKDSVPGEAADAGAKSGTDSP